MNKIPYRTRLRRVAVGLLLSWRVNLFPQTLATLAALMAFIVELLMLAFVLVMPLAALIAPLVLWAYERHERKRAAYYADVARFYGEPKQ